ncbi:hypothetical protein DFH28DRAFT_491938 [Melampsora americana]|nr:hypothetical protein DFH28DRAFT_491938 [Melampsora americana]
MNYSSSSSSSEQPTSDPHKRISAVINQPSPLNLIGSNIRPDHSTTSTASSTTSSTTSSASASSISSNTSTSIQPHHSITSSNQESDDLFLPLQSDSNLNINFSNQLTSPNDQHHHRRHSRVHSRNLSVFFPRPNQERTNESHSPSLIDSNPSTPTQVIEIPIRDQSNLNSSDQTPSTSSSFNFKSPTTHSQTKGRRGHHHRHSLSHKFSLFISLSLLIQSHSLII